MSAQETLGIRCSEISQRHRLYGKDVPCLDLDFVLLEYDSATPVALIEHKYWRGQANVDLDQTSLKAFAKLGNLASLPAFVAQYKKSTWEYRVHPANDLAKMYVKRVRWMTEREYVSLLHQLRGKSASPELLETLKGDPFDDEDEWDFNPLLPASTNVDSEVTMKTILGVPWIDDDEDELLFAAAPA